MWFSEAASSIAPGREQLAQFLIGTRNFLSDALESKKLSFLWKGERQLHQLALTTFKEDVVPAFDRLGAAVQNITDIAIFEHGLSGSALRFKLAVVHTVGMRLHRATRHFSIRKWFSHVIDAIDAILDSILQTTSGVGGLIKEFKDALRTLA